MATNPCRALGRITSAIRVDSVGRCAVRQSAGWMTDGVFCVRWDVKRRGVRWDNKR